MTPLTLESGAEKSFNTDGPGVDAEFRRARQVPGVFLMSNSLETGGSERQFSALARSLDPSHFKVNLGCIMRQGPFLAGLGEVPEFPLGNSLYGMQSIRTRLSLGKHLKQHRIAIAHAFDFYTNLTLIPAARWAGIPVLIGSQRQLGDLLTWKQERAQAAVLRWCDMVVCNSRAAAARLCEFGLRAGQLAVIGNGLPAEAFTETAPALPVVQGVVRVGMIARMNLREKNHALFLRVAAKLHAQLPNLEFVLVGDGPLRPELEKEAAALGLGDKAIFLGDRRDIPSVLAALDVTVQPSASESLSNVILESMAAGVPVVANRIGGNPELVAENRGILVPPNDEDAFIGAIARLVRDGALRETMGRNAREFTLANFTLDRMRERHEQLYSQLLERKGRRQGRVFSASSGTEGFPRKKIAIVAASLRYVGGQSVQAELLLRHWKNDRDAEVKFIPIDPLFPRPLSWIEKIPLLRTIVRQPIYMYELWRGLGDADIAHIFSASYWSFLVAPAPAGMIARWRGKKVLIHYHSGEARDHLERFRSARPILKRADRLVVPSGFLVDVFREFGLKSDAIPNIVDTSQFSFRARRPLRPHLVCTRGFHAYYSVDVVVRAFAEVQKQLPDARLDLVGGGELEAEIRGLVKSLNLSGVEFKGVVARQEIGRSYDAADIFINGSRLDNMPVSILEAFASGLPVVTTEPEGMRCVVEHERTGLLSPVGDAKALADNVIRVLRNPELAERLIGNAQREMERYSWPIVRGQWWNVYCEMTDRPQSMP